MIRSTLSFCALFGGLLLGSKLLLESAPPTPSAAPAPAPAPAPLAPTVGQPPASRPELPPPSQSSTLAGAIRLVSYEKDLTEEIGDSDQDEAAPRPTRALEDLLRDVPVTAEPELETTADESKSSSESSKERDSDDLEPKAAEPKAAGSKAAESQTDKTEVTEDADADPAAEASLTSEQLELRDRLRQCLAHYYFRPENVATRSPWGSMHWMLAYGVDSQLIAGTKRVNAIGYLNYNGVCNGQRLFYTSGGKIQAQVGVGVQGHAGQYLAMLAQSRVKADYPMLVDGQKFTVADLIEHEKLTCRPASELTFKLISLSHYLKSDDKWTSNDGQQWDIPRLIKEELAQTINGAACGGTHRMTGFSYAVRKREQRGERIEGQWKRAKKFVEDFHEYTFKLQNADGSFSTAWFVMRAEDGDIGRRLQTTGHITEWLAFSLSKEQLAEPRMVKSVDYLTTIMLDNRNEKWSPGPLGHAIHALAIYDERVFGGKPGTREQQLAEVRRQQLQR
jgi:hypothetical protein